MLYSVGASVSPSSGLAWPHWMVRAPVRQAAPIFSRPDFCSHSRPHNGRYRHPTVPPRGWNI